MVKDSDALLLAKADLGKRPHQRGPISRAEDRLWIRPQRPEVHHSLVDSPLSAPTHQFGQGGLAGRKVETTVCANPDEFTGADDMKFERHRSPRFRSNPFLQRPGRL